MINSLELEKVNDSKFKSRDKEEIEKKIKKDEV